MWRTANYRHMWALNYLYFVLPCDSCQSHGRRQMIHCSHLDSRHTDDRARCSLLIWLSVSTFSGKREVTGSTFSPRYYRTGKGKHTAQSCGGTSSSLWAHFESSGMCTRGHSLKLFWNPPEMIKLKWRWIRNKQRWKSVFRWGYEWMPLFYWEFEDHMIRTDVF